MNNCCNGYVLRNYIPWINFFVCFNWKNSVMHCLGNLTGWQKLSNISILCELCSTASHVVQNFVCCSCHVNIKIFFSHAYSAEVETNPRALWYWISSFCFRTHYKGDHGEYCLRWLFQVSTFNFLFCTTVCDKAIKLNYSRLCWGTYKSVMFYLT